MSAPLSWYHAMVPSHPGRPSLSGAVRARVCVIGGGLAGVSTGLHLAERGVDTVLLEAEAIGHGASGRNGGQIVQGFSASMDRVEAAVGRPDAQALWDLGVADDPLDPDQAKELAGFLGPLFSVTTLLFIIRIVMTWYPSVPVSRFPWVVAYLPTEPLLKPTRSLVPPIWTRPICSNVPNGHRRGCRTS